VHRSLGGYLVTTPFKVSMANSFSIYSCVVPALGQGIPPVGPPPALNYYLNTWFNPQAEPHVT
jgi:hypothetical protein